MKVLIVEDSASDLRIISNFLKKIDCTVVGAETAEQALECMSQPDDFSLVIVDWNLPGMDGVNFIKKVRTAYRGADSRIVMITGECEPERINEAIEAGVDEYIMKPLSQETFWEKLRIVGVAPREVLEDKV